MQLLQSVFVDGFNLGLDTQVVPANAVLSALFSLPYASAIFHEENLLEARFSFR